MRMTTDKIYYGNYRFVVEFDSGSETGSNQLTVWVAEKADIDAVPLKQLGAAQLLNALIIGYEDRFVRFGYDWFEAFCQRHGTDITVINGESFSPQEEVVRDLTAIITVFSARLPGLRSHKNAIRAAAPGKDFKDDQSPQDTP